MQFNRRVPSIDGRRDDSDEDWVLVMAINSANTDFETKFLKYLVEQPKECSSQLIWVRGFQWCNSQGHTSNLMYSIGLWAYFRAIVIIKMRHKHPYQTIVTRTSVTSSYDRIQTRAVAPCSPKHVRAPIYYLVYHNNIIWTFTTPIL